MRQLVLFFALVSVGSINSGSFAQSAETGSIIPKTNAVTIDHERTVKGDKARRVADGFAVCIVGRHYRAVIEALEVPINTVGHATAFLNLMDRECLNNGRLSFSSNGIRGSLYKALVVRDFRSKPVQFSLTPLDFEKLEMTATERSFPSPASEVLNFAGCIIRRDIENSKGLILSQAGSKGESDAIKALEPSMGKCVAADRQLSFSKDFFAGAVAEAFYREAQAFSSFGKP